ncbi:fimbria/pilus outer membrane usher protein [Leminorella grimontii]|uniref:fimbria/pilus outer membrane usher protein n=1 Tax=Leminorella grimontii TaxID=82981 RepID=UPI002080F88B|nr:fimbria/pilus outer membrane usher protein [Leminorella grimontii]GKX59064.1 outer membrane usher protein [Leminorella grimontii]
MDRFFLRRERLLLLFSFSLALTEECDAREIFNMSALEIDREEQSVVDLSYFSEDMGQMPGTYRVSIFVNGEPLDSEQDVEFVAGKNGLAALITPEMLSQWGVRIDAFPELSALPKNGAIEDLGRYIPMSSSSFNFNSLRLDVSIPQAAIRSHARGWVDPTQWDEGIPAAVVSYMFNGSRARRDDEKNAQDDYFLNLQSGLNAGSWRLRNYSTWNYASRDGGRWDSINTYLQRDVKSLKGQLTLGDGYTPSDVFDSIQFRGAQLASDDNMLPDSLRGFAPVVRGIAQSNAKVSVRQNGYVIYQTYVAPGAFEINDLYPTSGSGDLTVTIEESDGSERSFVQPFSAVPIMQREGRLKYALTAGKYRDSVSGSAEPNFTQATAIYGLPKGVTGYGGALYSEDYRSGVMGLGFNLRTLGSVSTDMTVARSTINNNQSRRGQSYRFQYSKDVRSTGTTFTLAAYRYSTSGFYTFQEANSSSINGLNSWQSIAHKRQKFQLDISQNLGDLGSFYISGYQQNYWNLDGYERTISTGWSSVWRNINYSLTYSYSDNPGGIRGDDQRLAFSIQVPLGGHTSNVWANYSANASKGGKVNHQIGINGLLLEGDRLSYGIQQSYANQGGGYSGNASLNYKGTYGELSGGYNYDEGGNQVTYGVKGGMVLHQYGLTLSQPLGESIAVVRAPGASGVRLQNGTGIYTDWRGYTVIPYLNPYQKNRIGLDSDTFGDDVDVDTAVRTVTPTRGAVVLADFNTRVGRRVLMTLSESGRPLPFGSLATLDNGGSGIVGEDGLVYLMGVPDEGDVIVSWNGEPQCTVFYRLPDLEEGASVTTIRQECQR